MNMSRVATPLLVIAFALTAPLTSASAAQVITILVANKGTPAYDNAKKLADGETVFAERKLHKALSRFEKMAAECPQCPQPRPYNAPEPKCELDPKTFCEFNIKLATGEYKGKGGAGGFACSIGAFSDVTLRILGGYQPRVP